MDSSTQEQGLQTPVRFIKGVGEARAEQLQRMEIHTAGDLLLTLPHRYEDRTTFARIGEVSSGDAITIKGRIMSAGWVKPRYGKGFFEAVLGDGSGVIHCRWFNAHYLEDQLHVEDELVVFGKVSRRKGQFSLQHPEFELIRQTELEDGGEIEMESLHVGRIVPVYPLTENLPQRVMRRIQWHAVHEFAQLAEETLPAETRERWKCMDLESALREVHFPSSMDEAHRARFRLVFEEFLCMQLILAARKIKSERFIEGTAHHAEGTLRQQFLDAVGFELTGAQSRVIKEISGDMQKPRPMHRLLQGDVGSGKTLVAACALLDAIECGSQGAIMAPTEILAAQHAKTFERYLASVDINVALLTGNMSPADRKKTLKGISDGTIQLVVGTHAIIQEGVDFQRLGLIVIDEQHKFGVEQRGNLYSKGTHPDVLVMTATPIPRTLAMTVYGDLDVSIIDEMPKGRKEIVTRVIKEEQLPDAYDFIRKQVAKGRQAFIVYPLVSESDKLEMRAAESMYKELGDGVFRNERLGLLHGQLKSEDKDRIMSQFRKGEIDILVSTTVVEVGVDVPNANIMLVEHAERFGLAQLHQLRGRIGRGAYKSFCILQGKPGTLESWKRLKVMEETLDGFRIAEEDLKIRGMGNLLGREQSGIPLFRVGDPLADIQILQQARQEAFALVEADPHFKNPEYEPLRERARSLYRSAGTFIKVG